MDFNYIDICFGVLFLFAAISGFKRGFIFESLSLIGCILAIWGAISFSNLAAEYAVNAWGWNERTSYFACFIIIFIAVIIVVRILAYALTKLVSFIMLGMLNRLLGMLFSICKMLIFLSALTNAFDYIDKSEQLISKENKQDSKTYEPIKAVIPSILPFIEIDDYFKKDNKNGLLNT